MERETIPPPADAGTEGNDAWSRSIARPDASWLRPADEETPSSVAGRLASPIAVACVRPKFALRADDVFFCIGSCFAREIEEQLLYRGIRVRSFGFRAPLSERHSRLNALLNKYTTASMVHELRWALDGVPFGDEALVAAGGGYYDLQMHGRPAPVTLERARERRMAIAEYFGRVREADVVVVTLGLAEVWFDRHTGLYLNATPTREVAAAHPGRFTVHMSDYAENVARLEELTGLVRRYGRPGVRIILTVSPVPLHRTFTDDDALVANSHGKATLRAAAGDFARAQPDVQYFPSYEMVTASDRDAAFEPDRLHVRSEMVDAIIATMLRAYDLDLERAHPEFLEPAYLRANPDVREAVAQQQFETGWAHWHAHGRAEGRPLRP